MECVKDATAYVQKVVNTIHHTDNTSIVFCEQFVWAVVSYLENLHTSLHYILIVLSTVLTSMAVSSLTSLHLKGVWHTPTVHNLYMYGNIICDIMSLTHVITN